MKCVSPFYVVRDGQWVPCQKCNFCVARHRSGWSFRLYQHLKAAKSAAFITLTYDDEHLVHDVHSRLGNLEPLHMQLFWKRLRKAQRKFVPDKIEYYQVGEYGELLRPHYHAITFGIEAQVLDKLADIWGHGSVHVGEVEPASIAYVSGYVIARHQNEFGTRVVPFSRMSKGLGDSYLTPQMVRWHKRGKRLYGQVNGVKVPLARRYKDKIFSKLEKEVMRDSLERELDEKYLSEVERLSALHEDPVSYYQMKVDQAYSRVKVVKGIF